jgi:hypothetical protein
MVVGFLKRKFVKKSGKAFYANLVSKRNERVKQLTSFFQRSVREKSRKRRKKGEGISKERQRSA